MKRILHPSSRSGFRLLTQELFTHAASLRSLNQANRHGRAAPVAINLHVYGFPELMLVEGLVELVVVGYFFAVDPDNDIAQLDIAIVSLNQTTKAGVRRRSAGYRIPNQHTVRNRLLHLIAE